MVDVLRPLRINALELLRQPGIERAVELSLPASPLGIDHDRLGGEVEVDLLLTSMNDGIVVTGEVRVPWAAPCRRCLRGLDGIATAQAEELYQVTITDPDAFAIENQQLDLAPMVREVALLHLDDERVCREDCAGLCPVCGIDRNTETCECDTSVRDDRWAALDGLVLDD